MNRYLKQRHLFFSAIAMAMGMLFFAMAIVVWNLIVVGWNSSSSSFFNIYQGTNNSTSTENLLFVDIQNVST